MQQQYVAPKLQLGSSCSCEYLWLQKGRPFSRSKKLPGYVALQAKSSLQRVGCISKCALCRDKFCSCHFQSVTALTNDIFSSFAQTETPVARTNAAVDFLPHRCVSWSSFCSQVLLILTVLQEAFHRHGRCKTVACKGFSNAEFCEHVVPKSWVSSPQPRYYHLILSGEFVQNKWYDMSSRLQPWHNPLWLDSVGSEYLCFISILHCSSLFLL